MSKSKKKVKPLLKERNWVAKNDFNKAVVIPSKLDKANRPLRKQKHKSKHYE